MLDKTRRDKKEPSTSARAREGTNHGPEPVAQIVERVVGSGVEPEVDAYVFAVRILGYAPNSEDFRAEVVELETQFGVEATIKAEQDVYRAFINDGRRPKPFDLVKDTRTLLKTGHHLHEKEQTAEERVKAAETARALDAQRLAEIKRQQDEDFKRHHPDWKPA